MSLVQDTARVVLAISLGFGFYFFSENRFDSRMRSDITILEQALQKAEMPKKNAEAIEIMFRDTAGHVSSLCFATFMAGFMMMWIHTAIGKKER